MKRRRDDEGDDLEAVQEALGYHFENPSLLRRALTHPSYVNEHAGYEGGDNQRLEFLGDAVLDFATASWVFGARPEFDEGRMTRLRAALVRTDTLADLGRQIGLVGALLLGHGEMESGGGDRDANLCDAFEAVVGAFYLDAGPEAVRVFIEGLIVPVAEEILESSTDWDAKSRLQEWSQAELGVTPVYRISAEKGPDHAKTFDAEVLVGEIVAGRGSGPNKQAAEQSAAEAAWGSDWRSSIR